MRSKRAWRLGKMSDEARRSEMEREKERKEGMKEKIC
jgi:hypothetical protein